MSDSRADDATTARDLSAHPAVRRVTDTLRERGVQAEITVLPDAVRTAAAAAEALGITPAEIANSLVFQGVHHDGTEELILILSSGGHRVNEKSVRAILDLRTLAKADAESIREATGFAIGGVAPVGHLTPLRTFVDSALSRYPRVWAAAGHSHTVFPTTYRELLAITGGSPLDVG
ncbi:YbaK/EbsC family protein [Actinomycetota bacterium]